MNKKIALGLAAVGTALAMLPLFAAFEAHVVNVTARIENALTVPVKILDYGTVFPQEYLLKDVGVALSQSFIDAGRVDDVQYFIRQKPKCAITTNGGQNYDNTVGQDGTHLYTGTGHVIPTLNDPLTDEDESKGGTAYTIDCGPTPRPLNGPADVGADETWGPLPSLCEYLSKHENTTDVNDGIEGPEDLDKNVDAFHVPFTVANGLVTWTEAKGYLAKSDEDERDNWVIDLAVPCFGGYCAQDWADFVKGKNPTQDTQEEADSWTQPIANEHKVFGCDLWFEVSGVSTAPTPTPTP